MRLLLLAACLAATACGRSAPPPAEPPPPGFEAASADRVAHGERLGRVLGCRGCHGDDLTGRPWIEDPRVAVLFTSNLTRAVPDYDDAELARAIRLGLRHDGSALWDMPSDIFTDLGEADMAALIAWLRTLAPAGEAHPRLVLGPEGRRLVAAGEIKPAPMVVRENRTKAPPPVAGDHERARYMIRATCSECHGLELTGREGSAEVRPPPDLIVVAAYDREQFRRLMRSGKALDGREMPLMSEVARGRFAHLTASEVDAIYDYLIARAQRPQ